MFGVQGILQMIIALIIMSLIIIRLLMIFQTSTIKVMLLGMALIFFSSLVLKDRVKYGVDEVISILGLSLCIAGFIKKDNIK